MWNMKYVYLVVFVVNILFQCMACGLMVNVILVLYYLSNKADVSEWEMEKGMRKYVSYRRSIKYFD